MTDGVPPPSFCVVLRRVFLVAWLEFLLFFAISLAMRGNAMNGKIEGGQHFLGSHGHYRPVSGAVFRAMQAFEALSLLLFIAGLVAMLLHNTRPRCRDLTRNRLWPW